MLLQITLFLYSHLCDSFPSIVLFDKINGGVIMKEAFLPGYGLVSASQSYNTKIEYNCPYCGIPLKLKSIDGKVSPYFGRKTNSEKHDSDCPYAISYSTIENSHSLIKESLENILQKKQKATSTVSHYSDNSSETRQMYIRTPKQLYNFCQSNTCQTEYRDGLLIDDILLSKRNIDNNFRICGVTGIHLVVGTTYWFDARCENPYIEGLVNSNMRKGNSLHFKIYFLNKKMLQPYIEHIFSEQPGKFANFPIAVLGNWKNPKKHLITTVLENRSNLFCVSK